MSLFGSTSPSYLIMLSAELALNWLAAEGKAAFEALQKRVFKIEKQFAERGFASPSSYRRDSTRIVLDTLYGGYSGEEFAALLRSFGMEPEFVSKGAVVLLTSPFNREEDFRRLEQFAASLPMRERIHTRVPELPAPEQAMSVRQAVLSPFEVLPGAGRGKNLCRRADFLPSWSTGSYARRSD